MVVECGDHTLGKNFGVHQETVVFGKIPRVEFFEILGCLSGRLRLRLLGCRGNLMQYSVEHRHGDSRQR